MTFESSTLFLINSTTENMNEKKYPTEKRDMKMKEKTIQVRFYFIISIEKKLLLQILSDKNPSLN